MFCQFRPVSYQADPPDHWELLLENIIFGEALGEGAFGKVYTATVSGVVIKSPSVSSESLDKYVKMGPNRNSNYMANNITMKAAVKVLQGMNLFAFLSPPWDVAINHSSKGRTGQLLIVK